MDEQQEVQNELLGESQHEFGSSRIDIEVKYHVKQ